MDEDATSRKSRRTGNDDEDTCHSLVSPWPNPNEINERLEINENKKKSEPSSLFDVEWPAMDETDGAGSRENEGWDGSYPELSNAQPSDSREEEQDDSRRQSSPGAFAVPGIHSEQYGQEQDMWSNSQPQQEDAETGGEDPAPFPIKTQIVDQDEQRRLSNVEKAVRQLQTERDCAPVAQVVNDDDRRRANKRKNIVRTAMARTTGNQRRVIGATIIMAIVVAVAMALVIGLQNDDERSVHDLIVSVSLDGGKALQNLLSPQSRALVWLENNKWLSNNTDTRRIQRYVLATLYYSTQGFNWQRQDGWMSNDNECSWEFRCDNQTDRGAVCESSTDALKRICIPSNSMKGTIPPEIALLSESLVWLSFSRNRLYSSIPSELAHLTKLARIYFISIERAIGYDSTPVRFLIDKPSEVSLLSKLDTIRLQSNQMNGTIPSEIAVLTNLEDLRLNSNRLSGTIPSELTLMHLTNLLLYNNTLEGPFTCPTHITVCDISCSTDSGSLQPNTSCRVLL